MKKIKRKKINKHGLLRDIPEPIKREIRQRCGFGCVICGNGIIDYEHVNPLFSEAKIHDPNKIALLCVGCHGKITRNFWSKEKVSIAMKNPKCKRQGFSFEQMDAANTPPYIKFLGVMLRNCRIPIEVRRSPLFLIEPPEEEGAPYRLSANFFDKKGELSLEIVRNEWRTSSRQWDVEISGGRIIVRSAPRAISLSLLFDPGKGIIIEKIDMLFLGYHFIGDQNGLVVYTPQGGMIKMDKCSASDCEIGISFAQ